jgi:dolichol-phosphate mannosyltransferase
VIYWNATHDWCSFAFQGTRRWSGSSEFSLPVLLGSALGQLTPVGLVGLALSFRPYGEFRKDRRLLFAALFVLIPLSVFIAHSFKGETKPNWTGPIWLAALPYLAWQMSHQAQKMKYRSGLLAPRLWKPVSVGLLVIYGGLLYGVQIGLPGFTGGEKMRLPAAWQEMAISVHQIEKNLKKETGLEPLVVGMDKYFLSSQLAFYDPGGPQEIAGRHLFGGNSLMWEYWLPRELAKGRDVIMVDFKKKDLGDDFASYFRELGPILDGEIMKNGQNIGRFFYRVGYGFNG